MAPQFWNSMHATLGRRPRHIPGRRLRRVSLICVFVSLLSLVPPPGAEANEAEVQDASMEMGENEATGTCSAEDPGCLASSQPASGAEFDEENPDVQPASVPYSVATQAAEADAAGAKTAEAAAEGEGGETAAAAAATPPRSSPPPTAAALPNATDKGLLDQELEELDRLAELYRQRKGLLAELQATLREGLDSKLLPSYLSEAQAHTVLHRPLPPLKALALPEDSQAAASYGDYLVSKAVLPQEEPITGIKFIPIRNPRAQATSTAPAGQIALPSALLVAWNLEGDLKFFTPTGELACIYRAGHDFPLRPLGAVAVSPLHDEYLVSTVDLAGIVRIHKVTVKQRRISKEDRQARKAPLTEKVSTYLGSQVNVTIQYNKRFRVPNSTRTLGERINVTSISMATTQGVKYFVIGDDEGNFTLYTRNGTLHARIQSGLEEPIEEIQSHGGNVLFLVQGEWGVLDIEKLEARIMICPKFSGRVTSVVADAQVNSRVIASTDEGLIWVFGVHNKRTCKTDHRFPQGALAGANIRVGSIRGMALALEPSEEDPDGGARFSRLTVLNMSHVGKRRDDPARFAPAVVWRREGRPIKSWSLHRRYQQGDLIAWLSEDGMEIELLEILMEAEVKQEVDNFSSFKMPVFAVAIVLVLGWQFVKGKGAFDPSVVDSLGGGGSGGDGLMM